MGPRRAGSGKVSKKDEIGVFMTGSLCGDQSHCTYAANHRLREHCSSCKEGRTEQNERSVLHQQNIHAWQLRIKLEWRVAPDVFTSAKDP